MTQTPDERFEHPLRNALAGSGLFLLLILIRLVYRWFVRGPETAIASLPWLAPFVILVPLGLFGYFYLGAWRGARLANRVFGIILVLAVVAGFVWLASVYLPER